MWTIASWFEDSTAQIERAMATLSSLQEYMSSAGPSLETVSLLYEASKKRHARNITIESQTENMVNMRDPGLPVTPASTDTEWASQYPSYGDFYAAGQEEPLDGLFDTLNWNQYFAYDIDYSFRIGFESQVSKMADEISPVI
jgi:hypothetical protein